MTPSNLISSEDRNIDTFAATQPSTGRWRNRGKCVGNFVLNFGKGVLLAFIRGKHGRGAGGGPGGGDGGGCGDGGGGGGGD